ncbi:hypothetical protein [Saccharophagus degradans]|uniref:ABC transporter permease n=1 Tax=Saccharophagus degradans TaxID=86304 RepID=A0AAW7XBH8_9GAMM|nr:hypothetical protein [Saccharophagus degradans]MDO6423868.1 hypothetical protein [Saccharophagus degradans]MDO6607947.1 hypothetical protein [Saccharophagus degradans]
MWHLILRDLKDLIGDLKYLFITLGVPLIATPLLIFLIVGMSSAKSQQEAERHYRFAINSTQVLPQFYTALKMEKQFNEQVIDKENIAMVSRMAESGSKRILAAIPDITNKTPLLSRWV